MLRKFDEKVFQTSKFCQCTIEIKKAFTKEENICDYCLKILENEHKDNSQIYVIWTENKKYRVFTNFHRLWILYSDTKLLKIKLVKSAKKELKII